MFCINKLDSKGKPVPKKEIFGRKGSLQKTFEVHFLPN
jgi:hypothetical protein